ncbi:MAG: protein-glutamate O-methyltransferase CheR [Lachnospiraceae bacterium]|nr:protein-glutamate O-methyltransferase CheR [Lachnospiraceae bacterium]
MALDYEGFKQQVYNLTKIDLSSYKERQMKRRIDALISKRKISDYTDYVALLQTDRMAFDEFVNYLTINVSEFYRNPEQWKVLEEEIFPELFQRFGKNLNIWSAACSTGDEPYSLVMLLSKFLPLNNIRITATDIDNQVLEKAKLGLYNVKSLKALPKEFVDKYFTKINDTTYQISDQIKSRVNFKQHNLLKDPYPKNCDIIICRNVLIYFTEEAKNEIYAKFNDSLKNEGIFFVGSTEQIIQPQSLHFESMRPFFYKKKI